MTKQDIIRGYYAAEKPYCVSIHTTMGGYMEFMTIEGHVMFLENAISIAKSFLETARERKHEDFKSICVRRNGSIVWEENI